MLNRLLAGAALGALLTACTTTEEGAIESAAVTIPQASGVFAQDSTLPFQTVDFATIQDSDYLPAFEQASPTFGRSSAWGCRVTASISWASATVGAAPSRA